MTQEELLAKIKAEIERRIKNNIEQGLSERADSLDSLLSFLSDLEKEEKPFKEPIDGVLYAAACGIKNKGQIEKSEKPMEHKGIDTEICHWIDRLDDKYCLLVPHYSIQDIKDTACQFYELGCRRTAEKYDEIEYKRQRADVCEGLEEELDKWRHEHFHGGRDGHFVGEYITRTSQLDIARHFYELGRQSKPKPMEGLEEEIREFVEQEWDGLHDNDGNPLYTADYLEYIARHFYALGRQSKQTKWTEKDIKNGSYISAFLQANCGDNVILKDATMWFMSRLKQLPMQQSKPKVNDEFDEEFIRYIHEKDAEVSERGESTYAQEDFEDIARHFAQWGAEHTKK